MTVHDDTVTTPAPQWIDKDELECLIGVLRTDGYTVIGPSIDQGAVVYGEIDSAKRLPLGWSDHQAPGEYRVRQAGHGSYFEFNVGPHSWKQFLFPPRLTVEQARRQEDRWEFHRPDTSSTRYALLGVRACELAAIGIQDRVMMEGPYVDREYAARRHSAFIVAVNCTVASSTCFCTSMDTGPRCRAGFDLALTETERGFIVEVGTTAGNAVVAQLRTGDPSPEAMTEAAGLRQRAEDQISKHFNTVGVRELLLKNLDHPNWDQVATRCLSCANCTMVCPTCFCSTVEEVSDLSGEEVDRVRSWDSCFNLEFGYTASGTSRNSIRNRYRQWLTHKLASWHDQFDSSGCVGCGRCVTWCPVGIDLTEEVEAIRQPVAQRRTVPPAKPKADACEVPSASAGGGPHDK